MWDGLISIIYPCRQKRGLSLLELLVLIAVIGIFAMGVVGCKFALTNVGNDQLSLFGIKQTAMTLGMFVGKSKTEADNVAIEQAYNLAVTGKLSEVEITKALQGLKVDDEYLMLTCVNALAAMGATIGPKGEVIDLSAISPAAWEAAKGSYLAGLMIGKSKRG